MDTLRRLQQWLGALGFVAFLITGFHMARGFPALHDGHEGIRMMYRATHLYLLFAGLLNLAWGLVPAVHTTFGWARRVEGVGRLAIVLSAPALLVAFYAEPPRYALERPLTFWAVIAIVAGTALAFFAHRGPQLLRPKRYDGVPMPPDSRP